MPGFVPESSLTDSLGRVFRTLLRKHRGCDRIAISSIKILLWASHSGGALKKPHQMSHYFGAKPGRAPHPTPTTWASRTLSFQPVYQAPPKLPREIRSVTGPWKPKHFAKLPRRQTLGETSDCSL